MIWDLGDCLAIRARLAAEDFDYEAFEPEVVARIERAAGRAFQFGSVAGLEVMS